jgi:hypothetical protein
MIPMLTALALAATPCEFAKHSAEAAAVIAAARPDNLDLAIVAEMRRIERDAICGGNAQR